MRDPSRPGVGPERRWKQLVGTLDAFVWEADAASLRLTSVDDRAEGLLGYPLDRWLTEGELRSRRDAVGPGAEHRRETNLPTAEGETLWFHEVVTLGGAAKDVLRGALVHVTGLRTAEREPQAAEPREGGRVGGEIIDRVDAAVVATDVDGTITYWNQHAARTYGYSRGEAIGRPLPDVVIPAPDRDRVREGILEAAAGIGWERELEALHRDGTTLDRWVKAAPLREESGDIVGVVWISVGAHESPRARSTLAASEAVKDGILQSALDCIITMDAGGLIIDFNPAAERTFGVSRDEAVGQELAGLIIPEHLREAHRKGLRRHLGSGRSRILDRRLELVGVRADGTEFPTELIVTRIDTGASPVFAGFIRDLTEQRRSEQRIAHLATRDQLTGLPNRRLLRDHLELAVARATNANGALALLHVDINRFGMVNETLGRASGDEALRAIGERLDSLGQLQVVARETGDEFLLVAEPSLHSTGGADTVGPATAQALAAAVADAIERPLSVGDRELQLGAHIGMSLLPGDADDADTLLDHAEAALREGQRRRKAVQIFEDRDGSGDHLSFLTDLRGALGRDEFELHYQPIVTLPEREVVGAEALIRWRHPERGLVQPNDFIPLLEDTGMIHPVGQWVVSAVFAQLNSWMELRPDFKMALNVSPAELAVDGLVERLVKGAEAYGIDPAAVSVEITETVAMSDPDRINLVLDQIADAGFPLAIDDFGTGHSSLARLWRLPVSMVKIDRTFTAAALLDPGAGAMVATIIRLADGLGVAAVAEGIETEEQLAFVSEHGCNLGQGFLFSRPVPAEEISALLRK